MRTKINDYCTVEMVELDQIFTDTALEANTLNRRVTKTHVRAYASDMKNGNWKFNGEPIIFTTNGRLIQGQHRLLAHKASGYVSGVKTLVVRLLKDEDNEAFKTLDCGMKRTYGQVLNMEGVANSNTIAAIRRAICVSVRDCGRYPTVAEMEKVGVDYSTEIESLFSSGVNFTNFGKDSSKAGFVVAAKAINNIDFVIDFIRRVSVGANLILNSPELAYKNFLNNYKVMGSHAMFVHVSVACKCILNSMEGKEMTFCRPCVDGIEAIKKVAKKNNIDL